MIPIALLRALPDIIVSAAAAYIAKYIITKSIEKKAQEAIAKASDKIVKSVELAVSKKVNGDTSAQKTVLEITKSTKTPVLDERSKMKYCLLLSYAYGKYGDENLLQILKDRGCIDDEDLKYIIEEIEK